MSQITLDLTENEFKQLQGTINGLKTQDNLHTKDPVFIVYQRRSVLINSDFGTPTNKYTSTSKDIKWELYKPSDDWGDEWLDEEDLFSHLNEIREDEGEELITKDDLDLDEFESVTMGYIDEFVGCYLTREAAQNHIDSNSYHYNQPFIFVESFWRNPEMENIRNILLKANI